MCMSSWPLHILETDKRHLVNSLQNLWRDKRISSELFHLRLGYPNGSISTVYWIQAYRRKTLVIERVVSKNFFLEKNERYWWNFGGNFNGAKFIWCSIFVDNMLPFKPENPPNFLVSLFYITKSFDAV